MFRFEKGSNQFADALNHLFSTRKKTNDKLLTPVVVEIKYISEKLSTVYQLYVDDVACQFSDTQAANFKEAVQSVFMESSFCKINLHLQFAFFTKVDSEIEFILSQITGLHHLSLSFLLTTPSNELPLIKKNIIDKIPCFQKLVLESNPGAKTSSQSLLAFIEQVKGIPTLTSFELKNYFKFGQVFDEDDKKIVETLLSNPNFIELNLSKNDLPWDVMQEKLPKSSVKNLILENTNILRCPDAILFLTNALKENQSLEYLNISLYQLSWGNKGWAHTYTGYQTQKKDFFINAIKENLASSLVKIRFTSDENTHLIVGTNETLDLKQLCNKRKLQFTETFFMLNKKTKKFPKDVQNEIALFLLFGTGKESRIFPNKRKAEHLAGGEEENLIDDEKENLSKHQKTDFSPRPR